MLLHRLRDRIIYQRPSGEYIERASAGAGRDARRTRGPRGPMSWPWKRARMMTASA